MCDVLSVSEKGIGSQPVEVLTRIECIVRATLLVGWVDEVLEAVLSGFVAAKGRWRPTPRKAGGGGVVAAAVRNVNGVVVGRIDAIEGLCAGARKGAGEVLGQVDGVEFDVAHGTV